MRGLQRVAIARDVLQQLHEDHYEAERGTYCDARFIGDDDSPSGCTVCALGALFASAVAATVKEPWDFRSDTMRAQLGRYFDLPQLHQIEVAFECSDKVLNAEWRGDYLDAAIQFGYNYPDDKARMIGIMSNIVRNKGTFVP